MKNLWFIPSLIGAGAGAWLGVVFSFRLAGSDAVWVLFTIAYSSVGALLGRSVTRMFFKPVRPTVELIVPIVFGLLCGLAAVIWFGLQNWENPL